MTPIKEAFEALLPEPAEYACIGGVSQDIYTADQMRQMFDAATERAEKKAFINALDKAYDAMFDLRGDKVTRFDAQTALRKLRDVRAAASIGSEREEAGK